jgi:hypothetical protein
LSPPGLLPRPRRRALRAAALLLLLTTATPALQAADPVRGAALYATAPQPGLLACVDCHSEAPQVNNFGNIFSGHNAVALIQRAIRSNTGGMGYFNALYGEADLADIAAYLGNTPTALAFALTAQGATSVAQTVTVSASTKTALGGFSTRIEGDFVIVDDRCGATVPRFSSCGIDVAFRPQAAGVRSGQLLIAHDGLPTPVRIALSGEAPARPPALARVAPASWVFADSAVGLAGASRSVTLHNDSDSPLALAAIGAAPADFVVTGGSCVAGSVLPPRQRCSIGLRFEPQAGGARSGELRLVHDGQGGGSRVALSGQGLAGAGARLRADTLALDFGAVEPATRSAARTLAFFNDGSVAWRGVEVSSSNPAFVVEPGDCLGEVAPQRACQVAVAFAPGRAGRFSGELQLRAPGAPLLRVPLAGRALAGSGWLQAVPARLSWAGESTREQTLSLVNRGTAVLRLGAATMTGAGAGGFSLAPGGCAAGSMLPPGGSCRAVLRGGGGAAWPAAARLQWAHDDAAEPLSVALQAGAAREGAMSELWAGAARVAFPDTVLGGSAMAPSLTLHNRGAAPLRWADFQVVGDHAADFAFAPVASSETACDAGRVLPPGASCTLGMRFAPRAAGARTASLLLRASDAAEATLLTLSGTAVRDAAPHLQADTPALRLPPRGPGEASAPVPLVVGNRGSAATGPLQLRIEGPFRVVSASGCAAGLAPGQRCTVFVEREPAPLGTAAGALSIDAGTGRLHVALAGDSVEEAPALVWAGGPLAADGALQFAATAVGDALASSVWTLANRGNAHSAPLQWAFDGPAAADFSVDADSACARTPVLAPGDTCTLRLWFHPAAAGVREARLAVGGATLALQAQGLAAVASPGLSPAALNFALGPGLVPAAQAAWLHNDGPAVLRVDAIDSQTAAFSRTTVGAEACPDGAFDLLPGEACSVDVAWRGGADTRAAGALAVAFDGGSALLPLSVSEDPALASNVGGGGAVGAPWLLALAAAVLLLRRRRHGTRVSP